MSDVVNKFSAFESIDPSILNKIVKEAESDKEARDAASSSGGGYVEGIPLAYLPEGKHTMRIFLDPELRMYRPVKYFTVYDPFKRIMDPRFYRQEDGTYSCEGTEIDGDCIERIWELGKDLDYGYMSRYSVLFYALLIDTDSPSDYWQKGTLYLVQGNAKFETAWLAQMASHNANDQVAPHIANSLNPTKRGWGWELTVVGGSQGSCSITPTFMKDFDAPVIDDTYLPLTKQVVQDGFSMEDFKRIEDHLINARAESGLDDEGAPGDDQGAPVEGTAAGTTTSTTGTAGQSSVPVEGTVVDSGNNVESAGPDALAAAMATGQSQGTVIEGTAVEVKTGVKVETSGEETYGLTAAQIGAAKAAGMSLKDFSEMINPK